VRAPAGARRPERADVRHQRGARRSAGVASAARDLGDAPDDGPLSHRPLAGLVRRRARARGAATARARRAQRRDPKRTRRAPPRARRVSAQPTTTTKGTATMNAMHFTRRAALAAALAVALPVAVAQTPSGQPIRIGSTLALTGPLAATAQIH